MERIPEPELMNDDEQALAYASADFEEPHNRFISLFKERFGSSITGYVLDLGCGPGDIMFRFARTFPVCVIHGVDGSEAMIRCGIKILQMTPDIGKRVLLIRGVLPDAYLPRKQYDVVISNSLLHHLRDPQVLWKNIKQYAAPRAPVFIMDLMRPASKEKARMLVETYSGNEPEILKRDFFNSLLAAFAIEEVEEQLAEAGLNHFTVRQVSDRHLVVSGHM